MGKYVFHVIVEASSDSVGAAKNLSDQDYPPESIDRKLIISPVIDFPNEMHIGAKIMLAPEHSPMKDRVADICHYVSLGYTRIDLEKKEVQDRGEFLAVIQKYMDVFDALHHQQPHS